MAQERLTDRSVRSAQTGARQKDIRDTFAKGLVLRVFPSGRKTWGVNYRTQDGRRRWFKLGRYPDVDLATARQKATKILGQVAGGKDPQQERERARYQLGNAESVADLCEEYLDRYARRQKSKRSVRDDRGLIDRYLLPQLGKRAVAEVMRRDLKRLLEDLADGKIAIRGQPTNTAPRSLRALLSKMFSWAVEEEIISANPAAGLPLPTKPKTRDRVLSEEEIKTVWEELERLDQDSPVSAAAFRFLLLTAQRPGEVLNMRWAEVTDEWWTIPAERMKNRKSHRVPLSPQAQEVLNQLKEITGDSEWVFESPAKPGSPLTTMKTANHTIRRRAEMEGWTPHDLRRTAGTIMAQIRIPPFTISKVLGHTDPRGVTAIYDRYSYDKDKRQALTRWGNKLDSIVSGKTELAEVVRIDRQ